MSDDDLYGPDMFFSDVEVPNPATVVTEPLPRAWSQGGLIEALKRSVIAGLRQGFANSSLGSADQNFYIDIEYPTEKTSYPGIWVQFSIDNLQRAGIAMETPTLVDGEWGLIQEWMFTGRITLTIAATKSKDRDRLADTVIAQLAFARAPDLVLRDPTKDAKEFRGLISSIEDNPYVFLTLNTDQISSSGQTVTQGTPWAPNMLLYEDNYSISCQGQFNLRISTDGVYTLSEIRPNPTLMGHNVPYNPTQWLGDPSTP